MGDRDKQAQAADMDHMANGTDRMSDPATLEILRHVLEDFAAHKREVSEERRHAQQDRHDFRAEVATSIASLREEMRAGFTKMEGSISKIHDRANDLTEKGHEREAKAWDWRLKAATAVIAVMAGVAGFAVIQWLLARGVAG